MIRHLAWVSMLVSGNSLAQDPAPKVQTDCGIVAGTADSLAGFAFKGIPYAMPPTQHRRWQRSVLLSEGGGCWPAESTFNATQSGPKCAQHPRISGDKVTWDGVEDCLTIDVWTQLNISHPRAVLVYIHGGSLVGGSDAVFSGLAGADVVVVGVEYRVNVLGFLALAELSANDELHASGNYGFSDQITALRWVQKNIHVFGGDPSQVFSPCEISSQHFFRAVLVYIPTLTVSLVCLLCIER